MANDKMMAQITGKGGFIAALDQSGGSTPGALRLYGIPDSEYSGEAEMFRLMHEMRVRITTSPAFSGAKVIGAILFERTMDAEAKGKPVPTFLWHERGVVPFLKVDKGLEGEKDGVALRATFVVDPQGIIRFVSVNDMSVGRNPQEVLRVLDALQTDELCPCNWQKGEETLQAA